MNNQDRCDVFVFERPSPQFFWKVVQLTVSFGYTGVLFQITPDLLVVTVNQCLHRFYEPDAASNDGSRTPGFIVNFLATGAFRAFSSLPLLLYSTLLHFGGAHAEGPYVHVSEHL